MKYFVKVELVLNVERFLPDFIREKWIVKTERIFPNQRTNLCSLFLFNKATYKHIVDKIVESESGEREEYQARSIIQNLLSLSESTRKIQKELEKTKGILSELAMKEGIECVTE